MLNIIVIIDTTRGTGVILTKSNFLRQKFGSIWNSLTLDWGHQRKYTKIKILEFQIFLKKIDEWHNVMWHCNDTVKSFLQKLDGSPNGDK